MSVSVAFDIYPAATPNGTLLVRLTADEAVELTCRKVLHGSGMGQIRIHSDHADATSANFAKRNYVKVVLVNGATETEWFGFFLEEGDFAAVSRKEQGGRQGGRFLTFKGPGSLFYLDRAVLLADIYAPGQPRRGNLELDGTWGWNDVPYGAIMTRVLEEGYYAPGNPLFYATWDFSRTEDSAAVAWPNIDNEYTVPWGTKVYDVIANFIKLDLIVTVDADLTFHAWQTYGTNRTNATFAANKVRYEHGVNIGNEVVRQIRASLERSHIFVTGDEFTSEVVSGGSSAVTYYDTIQRQDTNDSATLSAAGTHNLDAREIQADAAFPVRVIIDDDELSGLYVPGEHYDVGDIVSIHTVPPGEAANDHDYDNFAIEVAAIKLEHDDAGNWFAVNELGAQYLVAQMSAFEERSNTVINQISLCRPMGAMSASCSLPPSLMTEIATPNGDFEMGDGTNWAVPVVVAGDPSGAGGSWYSNSGSIIGGGGWRYNGWQGLTFLAGVTYVCRVFAGPGNNWESQELRFGAIDDADYEFVVPTGQGEYCIEWTPSANRTSVEFDHALLVSGNFSTDNLQAYVGALAPGDGHPDLVGTSVRATRCDHRHDAHRDTAPTVNDDEAAGYPVGTIWAQLDDLATPTEIVGVWILADATAGAAIWLELPVGTGSVPNGTDPGDLLVWDGSGWDVLPIGATDDHVLTVDAGEALGVKWAASGAGAGLPWFNIVDYGAVIDGSTDDTAAVQAAIDAAFAAGGGWVYHPGGVCVIAGALQDTGGANSQLLLPAVDYVDEEQVFIGFRGNSSPPPVMSVIGTTPVPDNHSIFKGTLNAGAGGAMLAGYDSAGLQSFTNLLVGMRDITWRLPSNPVLSALNMFKVAAVDIDNVVVDVGSYYVQGLTEPTTSTSYGIRLPTLNNGAYTRLGAVNVIGFYTGYQIGEHTLGQQVTAWGCKRGMETLAGYHASHFSRFMTVHCERGIVATGGIAYLHIDQYNVEHADSGWWITDEDVDDPNDYLVGSAEWKVTLANSGHDSTFTVDGGANFQTWEMGQTPGGSGHTENHDHDGSPTQKLAQANTHESPDTDSSTSALHHTLGSGANQAAPGNHGPHSSGGIGPILITSVPAGTPLIFADLLQNSEGTDLLYASEP